MDLSIQCLETSKIFFSIGLVRISGCHGNVVFLLQNHKLMTLKIICFSAAPHEIVRFSVIELNSIILRDGVLENAIDVVDARVGTNLLSSFVVWLCSIRHTLQWF